MVTLAEALANGLNADDGCVIPVAGSDPLLHFTQANTSGAWELIRFANNESGFADYSVVQLFAAGNNGETRRDNKLVIGYNYGSSGRQVTDDQAFLFAIENNYKTDEGIRQLEFYFDYFTPAGVNYRPFAITPNLVSDAIRVDLRANSTVVGFSDATYDWLSLNSTASSGTLAMSQASTIAYTGSVSDFVTASGHGLLGYASSTLRLGGNLIDALLFPGSSAGTDTLTLAFGGTNGAGLRYRPALGWERKNSGSSTWYDMSKPLNYYLAGNFTGIGPTSWSPDGATLEVYDATASTGQTRLRARLGAGQATVSPFEVTASDGTTVLAKITPEGRMQSGSWRALDSTVAMQTEFDTAHPVAIGSAGGIGFSSTSAWSGTIDTGIRRQAAGVVKLTNGSTGGAGLQFVERTAPSAPSTNNVILYAEDNGSGKTRLMALFPTGSAQQVAIEP